MARRRRVARSASAVAVTLLVTLLAACPFPLSQVSRPDFRNPVDPGAEVPLRDVLSLIPDQALRDAIAETGARNNTDVTYVDARDRGVADLTGLLLFPRLEEIDLSNESDPGANTVTSLAPVAGHPSLRRIRLSNAFPAATGNAVTDFTPLLEVRSLAALDLAYLEGASFADVAGLFGSIPTVEELSLRGWNIGGNTMPTLNRLRVLDVSESELGSLSQLSFPVLEELVIESMSIGPSDLSGGSDIATVRRIRAQNSSIGALTGIGTFTDLTQLDVADTTVSDLSLLSVVDTTLRRLTIRNLGTSAISSLPVLPNLEELEAYGTYFSPDDLAQLVAHPNLRVLYVGGFPSSEDLSDFASIGPPVLLEEAGIRIAGSLTQDLDVSRLAGWPVVELWLEDTNQARTVFNVSSLGLQPVRRLTLRGLNLGTLVTAGDIAAAAPNVEVLDLMNNTQITSVAAFTGLTELRELNVSLNGGVGGISSDSAVNGITGLASIESLEQVDLRFTDAAGAPTSSGIDQLLSIRPELTVEY